MIKPPISLMFLYKKRQNQLWWKQTLWYQKIIKNLAQVFIWTHQETKQVYEWLWREWKKKKRVAVEEKIEYEESQPLQDRGYTLMSSTNEVDVSLCHWRQDGQPSAIHPLYWCPLLHANMISSPSGKVGAAYLTGRHPLCSRESWWKHKRKG